MLIIKYAYYMVSYFIGRKDEKWNPCIIYS